jgi:hypothetical protein
LITGKEQTPSQAWGFQNPGGWLDSYSSFVKNASNLGMDAVLDPLNVIGVGVADDIFKIGVKKITKDVLKNPLQASEQLLKNQNFPRSVSELTSTGFKKDPYFHYNTFIDKKADIVEKLNTNEGRRRIENLVRNNPHLQDLWKTTDDLIGDFQSTKFETSSPVYDAQLNDWKRHSDGSLVYEPVDPNNAYNWYRDGFYKPAYVSMGMNYTPYDASHILEHEFAHTFQRGTELSGIDDVLGNIELKPYFETGLKEKIANLNPFNKNYDKGYSESGKIYGTGFDNASRDRALSNAKDYFLRGAGRGQERAAFSAELRENLMQRGLLKDRYDEITPEMLKEHYNLYKNTKGNKYNLRLYDIMTGNKNNFSYLSEAMNRLPAMVPPSALPYVGLGGAGYAGMKALEEQKHGGVIKDNRGQWAHPGEVTEIDSNNITMEGVPYNVLGVSDSGDTKLMKPGKNYKFKGKKVTEFPVAQEGLNFLEKEKDARTFLSTWLAKREKQLGENMETTNPRMIRQELGNQLQNMYDTPISYNPHDYADNSVGIPKLLERWNKESDLGKRTQIGRELDSLRGKPKEMAFEKIMDNLSGMMGGYDKHYNSIYIQDFLEPEEMENTILHELAHSLNYSSGSMSNYNRPYTHNINAGKEIPQLEKIKKIVDQPSDNYYDNPTEIYSRLMEFRKKNKLNPLKTYTIDDIKDLRERTGNLFFDKAQDYNLFDRYTDDQILKLINDVASGKKQKMPVGKLGINQLDAQPMKKLNQLLNFTNNPDKDNWLDKYN